MTYTDLGSWSAVQRRRQCQCIASITRWRGRGNGGRTPTERSEGADTVRCLSLLPGARRHPGEDGATARPHWVLRLLLSLGSSRAARSSSACGRFPGTMRF